MNSLLPPEDAIDNPDAHEVLRGWVVGGDLQVSLAFEAFGNDPAIWGQLLAETAVHVADAMASQGCGERQALLAVIQSSLLDNLDKPYAGLHGTVREPAQ